MVAGGNRKLIPTKPYHALHRVGIDLAHVGTSVYFLDIVDMEVPYFASFVRHRDPGIVRDHMIVNRLNCLIVRSNPCHLAEEKFFRGINEFSFPLTLGIVPRELEEFGEIRPHPDFEILVFL